jgi:hypothetical protein
MLVGYGCVSFLKLSAVILQLFRALSNTLRSRTMKLMAES